MANEKFLETYGEVPLEELINKIRLFSIGQLSEEELDTWSKEKVAMRANIGMFEKQEVMFYSTLYLQLSDIGVEFNLLELEKYKFFHVLLGYYTNIVAPKDKEKEKEVCTYKNYDLIAPLVKPWIMKACEFDYKETCSLIDQCFDWHRLQDLTEIIESIDIAKLEELTKRNEDFVTQMQSDEGRQVSQELLDIARFNDPTTAVVADALKMDAIAQMANGEKKEKAEDKSEDGSQNPAKDSVESPKDNVVDISAAAKMKSKPKGTATKTTAKTTAKTGATKKASAKKTEDVSGESKTEKK